MQTMATSALNDENVAGNDHQSGYAPRRPAAAPQPQPRVACSRNAP